MANYPRTVKTAREGRCTEITTLDPIFSLSDRTSFAVSIISGLFCLCYFWPGVYTKEEPLTVAWKGGEVMRRRSSQDGRLRWRTLTQHAPDNTSCAAHNTESNTKVLVESRNPDRERDRDRRDRRRSRFVFL